VGHLVVVWASPTSSGAELAAALRSSIDGSSSAASHAQPSTLTVSASGSIAIATVELIDARDGWWAVLMQRLDPMIMPEAAFAPTTDPIPDDSASPTEPPSTT
jgi:hypothetical protein